ncbi:MAG: small multi-drug export protein [Nanoarchaeota archaeon]|nr:small multi-drug export protein [Nanoarchaeota archaeon]MBU1704237.1 small multi-drug export protein [Nanoarchaeota archaeon]
MNPIITLILLTLTPALELRASIPFGILSGMDWIFVSILAVTVNIILGLVLYIFLDLIIRIVTKIKLINRCYNKYVEHTQKRIKGAVEKYGKWAVAIFIAIPLPGSGVYTGALAAYLIGLKKREFLVACILGVIVAGIIVTAVTLSGSGIFRWIIK